MEAGLRFEQRDFMACCSSVKFAAEMAMAGPFFTYEDAISIAKDIWFNNVDVNGWLQAFAAHPPIGRSPPHSLLGDTNFQWSKSEQSAAIATATDSTLQALSDWNARYMQKFGFVFIICASGRSTPEILSELKERYLNRPIVEFEIAAQEQMEITKIRLAKLFSTRQQKDPPISSHHIESIATKSGDDTNQINSNLACEFSTKMPRTPKRTRPPITTHVLDITHGSPASGLEVLLETWKGEHPPMFSGKIESNLSRWIVQGHSKTDKDGRCNDLVNFFDDADPGIYRISFNTGKYFPSAFFPHVSVVFEIRESQKAEHFHVPLLLSPFSFTTYRGT